MTGEELRKARKGKGKTQSDVARSLGASQGYVSLLESGARRVPARLAKRFVKLFELAPTALPVEGNLDCFAERNAQALAEELAALGYPGFSYLRSRKQRNPAEVLLSALYQKDLESRLAEALPWILLHYPGLDQRWLAEQARVHNLQNRLGFVVALARELAQRKGRQDAQLQTLAELEAVLEESRLAREDTFCQESSSEAERRWLRGVRAPAAQHWNLLTDWTPESVRYA
jgi:transcriptional regulator with XRE-family HTH domain